MDNLKAYATRLAGILTRFDETEMRRFNAERGLFPSSDEVFWRQWHKARTASTLVAEPLREESRQWLLSRGSEPWG